MDSVSNGNGRASASLLFTNPRNGTEIIPNGGSLNSDLESLTVSTKPISKNSSNKMRKRVPGEKKKLSDPRPGSSKCLTIPVKSNGCKVCTCDDPDSSIRTKSAPSIVESTAIECFSYKRTSRKGKLVNQERLLSPTELGFSLPDDVLELILVQLPLPSLMAARCTCRKWRDLTTSRQFVQLRSNCLYKSPWLFLFGVVRDHEANTGGEIHALDLSGDRWHSIRSDRLKGRFLYSPVTVGSDLYVIGGCSGAPNPPHSVKTNRSVMVFSPLTGLWRKVASMHVARSRPIVGAFEITHNCTIFRKLGEKIDPKKQQSKARLGLTTVSDVYQDPHSLSLRRSLRDAFDEDDSIVSEPSKSKVPNKLGLIVIGGHGNWEEPLDSGEIYDPINDRWIDIAGFPGDLGLPCSGTTCGRKFYVYTETDNLAAYDLDSGIWVGIQTNRFPPRLLEYTPKVLSCGGDCLFMLCVSWCEGDGQVNRREKAVRKVLELEMSSDGGNRWNWREVSRHPDAPMDCHAAYVADGERIYGLEMFKIFGQVLDFVTACHVAAAGNGGAGGGDLRWSRVSRNQMAHHEVDPLSCSMKSLAVLHL